MAQLMSLPLTVSCFTKIQILLLFWYRLTWVVLEKGPLNVCVCLSSQKSSEGRVLVQFELKKSRLNGSADFAAISFPFMWPRCWGNGVFDFKK